jgi:hypothetical protein
MKMQMLNGNVGRQGRFCVSGLIKPFIGVVVGFVCVLLVWQWRGDTVTTPQPPMMEAGQSTVQVPDERQFHATTDSIRYKSHPDFPEVLVRGARVSLKVLNRPLLDVVNEIGRQSEVTIAMGEGMPNPSIAMEFRELPLEQGLKRLFQDYDTFFFYSRTEEMPARLTTVWVYPPGQGQKLAPIPTPHESLREEWAQDVDDPDALKRALAITTLAERHGNAAAEVVKTGLVDFDERVRVEALQAALYTPVDLPVEALKEMVWHDPSGLIRSIALAGLVNRAEQGLIAPDVVWELLETAQRDTDPAVSELAVRISESWEEAAAGAADSPVPDQAAEPQLDAGMSQGWFDPR